MQEIKIKNIIIGKQFEDSDNLQELLKIAKEKKSKVKIVEAGEKIKIENNLYFDVLWPKVSEKVNENILNNNSLVCKLGYNKFSMLFTGDIEEIAEKQILQDNKICKQLQSTILKIAHHGSKTSSIQEFLEKVKPKIALIGVGKDNKFGHPNHQVLERLNKLRKQNI